MNIKQLLWLRILFCIFACSFLFSQNGNAATLHASTATNVNIPDYPAAGANSSLVLSGAVAGSTITAVKVYYEIRHPFVGDLEVWLTAFYGGVWHDHLLRNRLGGTANEIVETQSNLSTWNGASPNQTWYLTVKDKGPGDVGYIDFFEIWVDYSTPLTVPASPTNLAAAGGVSSIGLAWTDNSNNESGFRLERKVGSGGAWALYDTVGANIAGYSDTAVSMGTTYYYRVYAYNAAGPSAFYSNEASASPTGAVPLSPTNLAAAAGPTSIGLAWWDNSNNETGFRIERKIGSGGTWGLHDSVGSNVTVYGDNTVSAGTTYYYRVYAYNAAGPSPFYSNEASASPTGLGLSITSPVGGENWNAGSSKTITWDVSGSTAGVAYYKIALSADGGSTWPMAGTANDLTPNGIYDPAARNFNWTIGSSLNTTQARVRLRALASDSTILAENITSSNFTISPPITTPTLNVTSPNGGESWIAGSTRTTTWTVSGNTSQIDYFKLAYSTDGGNNFQDTLPNVAISRSARSANWSVPPGLNTTQARMRVRAIDFAGFVIPTAWDISDGNFTLSPASSPEIRIEPTQLVITDTQPLAQIAAPSPQIAQHEIQNPNAKKRALKARKIASKPRKSLVGHHYHSNVIAVRFRDGLNIRARNGKLTDFGAGYLSGSPLIQNGLSKGKWERVDSLPEETVEVLRQRAQQALGKEIADLNLQFHYLLPEGLDASTTIDLLNSLEIVELAQPVPKLVNAAAPNFQTEQGYLYSPPNGINALTASSTYSVRGAGIRLADVEFNFNNQHLDLPPVTIIGTLASGNSDHGTSVLGVIAAKDDGRGITGIAPDCELFFSAVTTASIENVAAAISAPLGNNALRPGDVLLIEQQFHGGVHHSDANPQVGLVPMEWYSDAYDRIVTAVGLGIIVVEAAGNGYQNLDDSGYHASGVNGGHHPFLPENDSGAIIVGAGASPGGGAVARSRLGFSNYGSTVDLQGWGENVWTTGGGDAYSSEGANLYYTARFDGTSSASPVVAGACVLLQSAFKAKTGRLLSPADMRAILRDTGTPQQGNSVQNIGPMPNVASAIASILPTDSAASFRIHNDGNAPLTVSSLSLDQSSPYINWAAQAPFDIPAHSYRTVTVFVDFENAPPGQTIRNISVHSSDFDENPYPGGVTVTVIKPVNTPPTISDIPNITILAGASASTNFTVNDQETSAGSLTLTRSSSNQTLIRDSSISFTGSGSSRFVEFTPVANETGSSTITITVTDADGAADSDSFVVTVEPQPSPPTVTLLGDMAFGNVVIGASAQRTLTIQNNGDLPLVVAGISCPGGFSGSFSGNIAGHSSAAVSVTFAPTAASIYTGELFVQSNATQGSNTKPISGTGIVPAEIVVEQPAGSSLTDGIGGVSFGFVQSGKTASLSFTVKNAGMAELTGLNIGINGANAARFQLASNPATTVAGGGNTTFTVRFAPNGIGPMSANLHLTSNDQDENPFDIVLMGQGITASEAWRLENFGGTLNSGNAADAADPDHDGVTNIEEYAYNLNPNMPGRPALVAGLEVVIGGPPGTAGLPAMAMRTIDGGEVMQIELLRRSDPELKYSVQISNRPGMGGEPHGGQPPVEPWVSGIPYTHLPIDDDWQRAVYIDWGGLGQSRRFVRVVVSRINP